MKKIKILSAIAYLIIMSTLLSMTAFLPALADEEAAVAEGEDSAASEGGQEEFTDYTALVYENADEKLATMTLGYANYGYELYYHPETAEIAFVNTVTGQKLFSNPWDVGSAKASTETKKRLLSQVIIKYADNDVPITFDSYTNSAMNYQIAFSNIRGGIRVDYTIGRTNAKRTLPRMIRAERFEELILGPIKEGNERAAERLMALYQKKDANDETITEKQRRELQMSFPITKKMAVYVIESSVVDRELDNIESWILQYTDYTYDDVLLDHAETEYEGTEKVPAVFRLALEYYIEEDGLKVRLPARGIRYDASMYQLQSIQILPYMGAGNVGSLDDKPFNGYAFIPDGSGTLVRFEDAKNLSINITGKLYGQDFAFHQIGSAQNMETWRMPVYGIAQNRVNVIRTYEKTWGDYDIFEGGREIIIVHETEEIIPEGFVAIMTEGNTLAELTYEYGGTMHKYHSVYPTFYPRPTDSYPLDGISVSGEEALWTVETDRRYTGNYTIKFILLNGEDANYMGMAKAYRNYLEENGELERLDDDGKDIPLYLESFGSLDTTQRKFGMPVDVKTPLTTFAQAQEMLETLMADGISNINLKYVGWANGGLYSTAPSKLKVQKELGGDDGLEDLVKFAKDNGIGIYPDLDFTYVSNFSFGDKFSSDDHAVKTVDDRVASHKIYDPVFQTFMHDNKLIISPRVIKDFYGNIKDKYLSYGVGGVSVATLGSELNSDHNEDNPLNREDSKERIVELLDAMNEDGLDIMLDAGNSYVVSKADHILNVPLDSSSRLTASEDIPFMGIVLHGHVEFAGTAINLAGDYKYNILKTIENGANPYFVLSYNNTSELKNSYDFNRYYSVEFDIWYEDLVETYNELNEVMKDVRFSLIDNHEIVDYRVIKVTYDNGKEFMLNYNNNEVTVDGHTIDAMGYIVLN